MHDKYQRKIFMSLENFLPNTELRMFTFSVLSLIYHNSFYMPSNVVKSQNTKAISTFCINVYLLLTTTKVLIA